MHNVYFLLNRSDKKPPNIEAGTNIAVETVTKVPAWAVDKPILSVSNNVINGPTKAPIEFIMRDKNIKYIDLGRSLYS